MCMFSIYFCNDSILLMLPTPFREQTPPGLCETFKIRQAFVSITIVGIQFTQRNLKGQSTFSFLVLFFFFFPHRHNFEREDRSPVLRSVSGSDMVLNLKNSRNWQRLQVCRSYFKKRITFRIICE